MGCTGPDVLERLMDGGLTPEDAAPLREHIRTCGACQSTLRHIADARTAAGEFDDGSRTPPIVETPWGTLDGGAVVGPRTAETSKDTVLPALDGSDPDAPDEDEGTLPPGAAWRFDGAGAGDTEEGSSPGEITQALPKGERIGRYVILEQLGVGGMGVVYAAFDPELNRKVALKLLRTAAKTSGTGEGRGRLLREAQAMARLSHPDIVSVYDVGSIGDEVYVAMELVQGTTLTRWLKTKRSWREVVAMFTHAGRGLAAAHAAGLVHRDFKPDNVLVAADGRVRVTDFGLARPAVGEGDPSLEGSGEADDAEESPNVPPDYLQSPLTRAGIIVGTPVYMAPEQFLGEPVDARTDQYAFCVALFEALYGQLPYQARSVRRLAKKALAGKLPRLPLDPRVPLSLHRIVLRGLRPRRDDRWPSMTALLHALELVTWLRKRVAWAAAALVLLAGGGAWTQLRAHTPDEVCAQPEAPIAGAWDPPARQRVRETFERLGTPEASHAFQALSRELDRYLESWTAAKRQACDATFVRHEQPRDVLELRLQCLEQRRLELTAFIQLLGSADSVLVGRSVQSASTLPDLSACADIASLTRRSRLPANAEDRKEVQALRARLAEAEAYRASGQYPEAVRLSTEIATRARALRFRPLEAEAFLLLGRLRDPTGDYAGAEQALLEAAWAAEAAQLLDLEAEAFIDLVNVVGQRQSRHEEGHRWGRQAEAVLEALSEPPKLTADLVDNLGTLYRAEGDYEHSLQNHQRALSIREKHLGPEHLSVAQTLQWLGMTYTGLARKQEALACYDRALRLVEGAYGPDHPRTTTLRNWHGLALVAVGQYDQALATFQHSLRADARIFGTTSPSRAFALSGIALSLMHLGQYEEAISRQQQAIAVVERALGPAHPRVATFHIQLSEIYLRKGDAAKALEAGLHALAVREGALGPEHFDVGQALYHVADAYLALGRPADAKPLLERALKLREGRQAYPEMLGMIRFALARSLEQTGGDVDRARGLAGLAEATFVTEGAPARQRLAAVRTWLQRHGGTVVRLDAP